MCERVLTHLGDPWQTELSRAHPCVADVTGDSSGEVRKAIVVAYGARDGGDGSVIVGAYCGDDTASEASTAGATPDAGRRDGEAGDVGPLISIFRRAPASTTFSFVMTVPQGDLVLDAPRGGLVHRSARGTRVSHDGGAAWEASDLPAEINAYAIVGPRAKGAAAWFLRSDAGCVWRSADRGRHWSRMSPPAP